MKKTFFTLLIIASCSISSSYAQFKTYCEAEEWSKKTGTLIETKIITIGKFTDELETEFDIWVTKCKDIISDSVKSYLTVRRTLYNENKTRAKTDQNSIDADETDRLIESIKYLQTKVFQTSPETDNIKYTFTSRTGIRLSCSWNKNNKSWELTFFIPFETKDKTSKLLQFDMWLEKNLTDFQKLIEQAKEKM